VRPGPDIGTAVAAWTAELEATHDRLAGLPTPYGDGHAAARIVSLTTEVAHA
jgi:UDP-N-acetylglucosamine 2-epimerase (non-hydrolysing)